MSTSDKAEWILYDTDLTTKLAILPVMSSHLYLEHNEPGSGEVKIPLSSSAAAVIENGMFIECLYRGQGRGSFFVDNIAKTYANADENAGKVLSVSGRGGMALLDDVIIYDGNTGETSREFSAVTKASIFITLLTEAQTRGALTALTWDFDAVNDSASVAWTDSETYKLNVGTSLLDVLRQFAKTGIDFEMNYSAGGFILSAYKNGTGTDKSETIYFRTGANCEEVASDERGDEIKNVLYTKYKDGFISVSDSTSISARRRREKLLSLELAQTAASATTYASAELSTNKDPKKSIAVRIYDGVNPRLFVDYSMGDYITLDKAGTEYRYRVLGIQADFSGDQYSNVVVELNSLLYANNLRMDQDLEWLKNQWNTARDSKLMAVSYWAAIGDPNITYDASNFVIIGDTLYMINSLSLYSYGLTSGVWTALEYGTLAFPKCLAAVGTDLYIGASLVVYKYDTLTATLTNVALTNPGDPLARAVYAMAVNGTTLYASGTFTTIDGVAAVNIAKLNTLTSTWSAMADQASFLATNPLILKMLFSNGLLYSSAGTQVQAWNGTTWSNIGSAFSTAIVCYAEYGTSLLVGNGDAGGIWEWDGATWAVFGGGVNNAVRAIAVYLTDVYVGGDFTDAGNYITRYSGGTWWQLETGANASVEHLILNGQDLYVAGNFTTVGTDNKEAQGIAAYFNNFTSLAEYLENSSSFNMGAAIHAAAANAITDTDEVPFWEATVNALRKITWANILTTIRTWLLSATATTQVLYNDAGVIEGDDNFIWDKVYSAIQIGGSNWYSALLYGGLHVTKENGGNFVPMMTGHSYGDGTGNFTNVPTLGADRAGGTKATPTAVLNDMGLARFTGGGYDGTALSGTRVQMLLKAAGNWSATSHPTAIEFWTTPSGSTTRAKVLTLHDNGGQESVVNNDTKDPTGWIDPTNVNVSYDSTARTITLTPVSGTLQYYWKGIKYDLGATWTSAAHDAADGGYFLYSSDGTNISWSTTAWTFDMLMVAKAIVSTTPAYKFAIKETHGLMPWQVHQELHDAISSYRTSGGALTVGTYAENTATDAANTPGFDAAVIKDEDNSVTIPAWTQGTYTTMRIGASSKATFDTAATLPFRSSGSYILVNNTSTGAETASTNNKYVNVYQVLIPASIDAGSQLYRMVMLQPQRDHPSLADAQLENPQNLSFGDLASTTPEFVIYARITYVLASGDANTGKARIATGGISYITGSRLAQTSISGLSNHEDLSGLLGGAVDEHYHLTAAQNNLVSKLSDGITAGKTLTLTATDNYNFTIPATGTAMLTSNKATGADVDTGADDAKFVTVKAINDSHSVPMAVPSTANNVLISNGVDWVSTSTALENNLFKKVISSIANNGTGTLTPLVNLSGMLIVVYNGSSGFRRTGVFIIEAYGLGSCISISDVASVYSTTAGTANKVNVYYTAAGIDIENKSTETINNVTAVIIGRQT